MTRAQIAPHLARGFPWHTPDLPHPAPRTPDGWWSRLAPVLVDAIVHGGGLSPDTARALWPGVRRAYLDPTGWTVYPDVLPCLDALDAVGWTHRILSNHLPELPALVAALGLAPRFERNVSSGGIGFEKPHARAFAAACDGLPPDAVVWMVGDSVDADVRGALAVGLPAVLVRRPDATVPHAMPDLAILAAWLSSQRVLRPAP